MYICTYVHVLHHVGSGSYTCIPITCTAVRIHVYRRLLLIVHVGSYRYYVLVHFTSRVYNLYRYTYMPQKKNETPTLYKFPSLTHLFDAHVVV